MESRGKAPAAGPAEAQRQFATALLRFLTTEELAERWRTTPGAIAVLRHRGQGPRGHRIGRRVLYDERDVEAYEAQRADQTVVAS
jgi:hypothetical protein